MELKNKWLLVLIKFGLDIAWYLNFLLSAITLFLLTKAACSGSNYHIYAIPVRLGTTLERYYPTYIVNGDSITMQAHEGSFIISTPGLLGPISGIVSFILYRLLFIAILFNLRKVFSTFYHNEAFQYPNIARLKIAALYIALYFPLNLIHTLVDYFVLKSYTNKFYLSWHLEYGYLAIAAIVYVTAEILRYGFELKKENEAFV